MKSYLIKRIFILFLLLVAIPYSPVVAQHHYSSSHHSSYKSTSKHRSTYNTTAKRDSHGRIVRSSSERHDFMKQTGYPHGRKGYVIDHIVPLSKRGCDCPSNMQWQTKEAAKEKDKWERK